ncbi:glycerophosphodiester phosphodiesterase [Niallia alba]|uniref:glycerophosphodiester phosphodiesterase n=1 Tax=Niallia alba TaxID=2729105 RepID=UPI00197B5400|nr:glycerophosphodiester phosphodiesterase family protein [Niallia alba]
MSKYLIGSIVISFLFVTLSACDNNQSVAMVSQSAIEIDDTPRVIAHRGANEWYNESTITAYQIAAETGVDSLEMDLRMTKDGELIVMHDETMDRTTNGKGKVSDYTLEEIRAFRTMESDDSKEITEKIPTLKEILETFHDTQNYYIETRLVDEKLAMEEKLIQLLEEYQLLDKELVTIQSFSEESLMKIKELAPDTELALLFRKGSFSLEKAHTVDFPIIGIESTDVTKKVVEELHKKGKEVHVYFINKKTQKEEQERVLEYEVDGYFTDYIHFTKEILAH